MKIVLFLLVAIFLSCAHQKNVYLPTQLTPFKILPEEDTGELLSGVGVAEGIPDISLLRETALSSAQTDLARKIQSKVNSIIERTMLEITQNIKKQNVVVISSETIKVIHRISVDTQLAQPMVALEHFDRKKKIYYVKILCSSASVERTTKEKFYNELITNPDKYPAESFAQVISFLQDEIYQLKQKEMSDMKKLEHLR